MPPTNVQPNIVSSSAPAAIPPKSTPVEEWLSRFPGEFVGVFREVIGVDTKEDVQEFWSDDLFEYLLQPFHKLKPGRKSMFCALWKKDVEGFAIPGFMKKQSGGANANAIQTGFETGDYFALIHCLSA